MNQPTTLSFWEHNSFTKDIDVAIIGSGIVGLNAALTLKEKCPRWRIAVIERGALPEGASTRNAGFACFGSITELLEDLEKHSENDVFSLVEKRFRGLQRLRQRIGDNNMSYQENGGFEIFKNTEGGILENCLDKMPYFNKQVQSIIDRDNVYQASSQRFGFKNLHSTYIHNTAEGQIDTGKMMQTLLKICRQKNIIFFNGLKIKQLCDENANGVILETEETWNLKAKKVVVATNGFAKRLLPNLAVTPARNQVLITQPLKNLKIKGCFHYDRGYFYFRNVGNRILFGGGRNLDLDNELTDNFATTDIIQKALLNLLETTILPNQKYEIDRWWSGILGIGDQKKPIVEYISSNIVVAVRMGGMGVAIGSLIGEEAANLIIG